MDTSPRCGLSAVTDHIDICLTMRFANCANQAQHINQVLPELVQHVRDKEQVCLKALT